MLEINFAFAEARSLALSSSLAWYTHFPTNVYNKFSVKCFDQYVWMYILASENAK